MWEDFLRVISNAFDERDTDFDWSDYLDDDDCFHDDTWREY